MLHEALLTESVTPNFVFGSRRTEPVTPRIAFGDSRVLSPKIPQLVLWL